MMFRETLRENKPTLSNNNEIMMFDYKKKYQDHQKENRASHSPFRGRDLFTKCNARQ
jgi:hypothetical protein